MVVVANTPFTELDKILSDTDCVNEFIIVTAFEARLFIVDCKEFSEDERVLLSTVAELLFEEDPENTY